MCGNYGGAYFIYVGFHCKRKNGVKKMSGYYRGAYFFQNAKYVSLKLFLGCIHIKYDAYYIEYF